MPREITPERFVRWLVTHGAQQMQPTNEWELARVRTSKGLVLIHTNKARRQTWNALAEQLCDMMRNAERPGGLAPSKARISSKKRNTVDTLAARDGGMECWFCGKSLPYEDVTIEHLVAVMHGGPNHLDNFVLACEEHNTTAARMSVAEKVTMREQLRGIA